MNAFAIVLIALLALLLGGVVGLVAGAALGARRERTRLSAVPADAAGQVEYLARTVSGIDSGLRSQAERLARLDPTPETLAGLGAALSDLRAGMAALQARAQAREGVEQATATAIRRLESVLAGTPGRGGAGENLLDVVFGRLPAEWQVRNQRVQGKVVEFGLRLPNDLVLPIDSKWAATELVERYGTTEDPRDRARLQSQIEATVLERAREVTQYVDPRITTGFAIAVVPDPVFEACRTAQVDAFRMNVVLLSHSLFVPYLLIVFQTALNASREIDAQQLETSLQSVARSLDSLQEELQGRFARAITMLTNSRDQLSDVVSRARRAVTSLRVDTTAAAPSIESPTGEYVPGVSRDDDA